MEEVEEVEKWRGEEGEKKKGEKSWRKQKVT